MAFGRLVVVMVSGAGETVRAKLPVAETTCSQVISPWSVVTTHSPLAFCVMPVTVVLR